MKGHLSQYTFLKSQVLVGKFARYNFRDVLIFKKRCLRKYERAQGQSRLLRNPPYNDKFKKILCTLHAPSASTNHRTPHRFDNFPLKIFILLFNYYFISVILRPIGNQYFKVVLQKIRQRSHSKLSKSTRFIWQVTL